MSASGAALLHPVAGGERLSAASRFAIVTIILMAVSGFLAGRAPLGFSIVPVFRFAGPHNWIEMRYFMGRLPGRFGPLRNYFLISAVGVLGLTGAFASLPWLADALAWESDG